MIIRKFFRLLNDTPDAGGTDTAVDRGDTFEPAEEVPEALVPPVEKDPKVKELEAELGLEGKDAEVEEGEAEAEKDAKPTKDTRIPAARHKEILEKERAKTNALAAEVAQLKQRTRLETSSADASVEFAALDAQVETLETEYANLLTDGEIKKAGEVMKKIRATERYMAEAKADLKIQAAQAQAQEVSRFQTALTRIETAYPIINPDHEDFDEKTEARVSRMNSANRAAGMSAVAALQDAAEAVLGAETTQQERAADTKRTAKDVGAERKAAAVEKAVKATAGTPPSLSRVGADSDKLGGGKLDPKSVQNMSQKQFAALSAEALAEMRGDTL